MNMEPKYCNCCGRLLDDIKKECLDNDEVDDCGNYRYGDHFYCSSNDAIYSFKLELQYCEYCGAKLTDDDLLCGSQTHEFWGAPCSEEMVIGYHCNCCDVT